MIPEPRLEQLYQEVILDHNKNPRNYKPLTKATQYSHGVNPLCGDQYDLYLEVDEKGVIVDVGFQGAGCAISKSSASLMTTLVKGKTLQDVMSLKENFLEMMTQDGAPAQESKVGRMVIFKGVKEFPVRVKCATLAWHALADALKDALNSRSEMQGGSHGPAA